MGQFQPLLDLNRKINEIEIYHLYESEKINNADLIEMFARDVNLNKEHFLYPNCDVFFVLTEIENQKLVCGCLFLFEFDDYIELHGSGHPRISFDGWKNGWQKIKEWVILKNKKIRINLHNLLLYNKLKSLGFRPLYIVMEYGTGIDII